LAIFFLSPVATVDDGVSIIDMSLATRQQWSTIRLVHPASQGAAGASLTGGLLHKR